MKTRIGTVIAALAMSLAASSAHAATTLVTAPLYDGIGLLECTAINTGTTTASIVLEERDYDGAIVGSSPQYDLGPHQPVIYSSLLAGAASCTIVVVVGNRSQIRAAANYRDPNFGLVIVPAR
jgi:hypothetical protein